jgi:O-antigen ligase
VAELLRVFFCAGVYFTAAYGLRASELRPLVFTVLALGTVVALISPFRFGAAVGTDITSTSGIFGNHEQFGSFVALLLIVALALALDRSGDRRVLLGAQAMSVPLAGALLLARTRSAWIGELAGLVTLTVLVIRFTSIRLSQANRSVIVGPALILCVGFAMLAFSGQLAPLLSYRFVSMAHVVEDVSFADRLHRWKSACRMAYERPIIGWGLGSFPIIQERWTETGDEPAQVLAHGTGHSNLAHNFWVQWAAETGGVGLALYVGMVVAFLLSAGQLVKTRRPGFRRTLLIGCLAATVTACADMVGAPSYTFPGVSALPWLWMGLGIAACRDSEPDRDNAERDGGSTPALPSTPLSIWIGAALAGLAAALLVLAIGSRQPRPEETGTLPAAPSVFARRYLSIVDSSEFHQNRRICVGQEKIMPDIDIS